MKNFTRASDIANVPAILDLIKQVKKDPKSYKNLGKGQMLSMLFFNPSLRTRMSTECAAVNTGMDVIYMDMKNSWAWELKDGKVMDGDKAEHIREAAKVIAAYSDMVAIRSFAQLIDKREDDKDELLNKFIAYCPKPVINLESALRHPLQSLTDLYTIHEYSKSDQPKIVLTWAPHPRPLPHTVALSFLEWMRHGGHQVTVTHPPGYELDKDFMRGHTVDYDQQKAVKGADFVYVKNWSSSNPYGKVLNRDSTWTVDLPLLSKTNHARLMHCLPVRRNMVIAEDALDSHHSIVHQQAANRLFAAQAILIELLKSL